MTTNELLDRYLSGAITAPQEAELERRAASDPVLADALAGAQGFPEEDHAARVSSMLSRARTQAVPERSRRVQGKDKRAKVRPLSRYAAAAAVVLLIVAALVLLPEFSGDAVGDLAMKTEAPAVPEPAPAEKQVAAPEEALKEENRAGLMKQRRR